MVHFMGAHVSKRRPLPLRHLGDPLNLVASAPMSFAGAAALTWFELANGPGLESDNEGLGCWYREIHTIRGGVACWTGLALVFAADN